MGLEQELSDFRAEFEHTAPAGRAALYNSKVEELRASFPMGDALAVGNEAPDFTCQMRMTDRCPCQKRFAWARSSLHFVEVAGVLAATFNSGPTNARCRRLVPRAARLSPFRLTERSALRDLASDHLPTVHKHRNPVSWPDGVQTERCSRQHEITGREQCAMPVQILLKPTDGFTAPPAIAHSSPNRSQLHSPLPSSCAPLASSRAASIFHRQISPRRR